MNKEPTIKKENAVSTNIVFEADANVQTGVVGQEDLALPFLKILGQLSPEVNKRDGKYVEGAEPGMIYNSVTGETFSGESGVPVIPCYYKLEYVEWKDRGKDGSGAPVKIYPSSSDIMTKTTRGGDFKDRLPNGNYIEKTAQHFVVVGSGSPTTALIIKMQGKNGLFTPATFSHLYQLKTVQQSNDKGTWFGWEVSKKGPIEDAGMYQQAKSFSESISKGDIEVKHGEDDTAKASDGAAHY